MAFSGSATVYKISLDGKVLKGKGLGQVNYDEQSKLKKSIARKYYRKAKILVGTSSDFNHPGNLYYSIATRENGKENKITWGDGQRPAPEPAKNLYQEITKILTGLTKYSTCHGQQRAGCHRCRMARYTREEFLTQDHCCRKVLVFVPYC